MKPRRIPATRFAFTLATAMAAFFCNQSAEAATITWSGNHTTGTWANSANWGGSTFANNDDVIFATGALRSLSFLGTDRTVNSITFQSGSGMVNVSLGSVGSVGASGLARDLTFRSGNTGITIDSGNATNINIGTGGLAGGATPNSFGNLVLAGNLSVAHNGSGTLTIDRPITGAFALTKSGAGSMVLSGSNTFTGGVTINAGTLRLGSTGALRSTAGSENAVSFGASSTGTLALAGNSVVVANLSTNATPGTTFVQNANGSSVSNATLTVGNSTNANGTYAGTIRNGTGGGTLALTKAGTGTLTLTGSNTFSGGVTISAGRINANSASALGANTVDMTGASTTLSFGTGTGSVTTFSNPINVTGTATGTTLIVATNAKVSLNAAITIAADTTIQGTGTDNQIGTTALGTITSSNNSNLTIAVNNSQTHVFAGKIDLGTGSVTRVAGSNANLTMSNANNSFSGGLFIGSVGGGGGGSTSGATTITNNGAQGSGDITFITGNTAPITFSNVSGTVATNIVSTGGTGGLIKTGASTMTLTGTNTYTGATTVSGGSLIINGAVASTSVVVNASLGGSGVMSNATLSGSGSINPGNSPGILTAAATNPSGGLDYNFEFTAANSLPTWNAPTASVNDVLRLTSATPFSSAMDSDNVISIYLNVPSLAEGDVFIGGFYTDNNTSFLSSISSATFQYFLANAGGGVSYGGTTYSAYSGPLSFGVATVSQSADFGAGAVSGYTTQFTVIPEPSVAAFLAGFGALALRRRRR